MRPLYQAGPANRPRHSSRCECSDGARSGYPGAFKDFATFSYLISVVGGPGQGQWTAPRALSQLPTVPPPTSPTPPPNRCPWPFQTVELNGRIAVCKYVAAISPNIVRRNRIGLWLSSSYPVPTECPILLQGREWVRGGLK